MSSQSAQLLDHECAVFSRYLVGHGPSVSVGAAYVRAHERATELTCSDLSRRERALLSLARRGPARTRAADSFARVFSPAGLLRRKLVCLLAILEVSAPTDAELDTADVGGALEFFLRFAVGGLGFALRIALVLLWLPIGLLASGEAR